ncbi:MAG: hypothetical protein QW836_09355 [Ignisphaera sp.]
MYRSSWHVYTFCRYCTPYHRSEGYSAMKLRVALAIASAALLGLLLAAIDWIAQYRYDEVDLSRRLLPPSPQHIPGTDTLGRDILTRLLYGLSSRWQSHLHL